MKRITLFFYLILLFAFTVGDSKIEYYTPAGGRTLCTEDLDNDGYIDVVVGHAVYPYTNWGGLSILKNIGNGYLEFIDSLYFEIGFPIIGSGNFDNNSNIDIFGLDGMVDPYTIFITIIYNYGESQFDSIKSFEIYSEPPNPFITSGDVNGDNYTDLLFAHNNNYLWGIIYNDGTGNFSAPEYYSLSFSPMDIACADLNGDGWDDVILSGIDTEIYFSTETGFEQSTIGNILPWSSTTSLNTSDFDNDTDNDIVISTVYNSDISIVYFYENLGNNQFYEHPYFEFTPFCSYSQIADFNNDSLPDMVFVASDHTGLYVYDNKGDFQLEYQQFISIDDLTLKAISCNDIDNNGFNDLVAIRSIGLSSSIINILFNDGLGNFQDNPITSINTNNNNVNNSFICYPNPIINNAIIEFILKEKSNISLTLTDISGNPIKKIINQKTLKGGKHFYALNANDIGNAGVYFLLLSIDNKQKQVIKLINK